jgi:hypothetical protein
MWSEKNDKLMRSNDDERGGNALIAPSNQKMQKRSKTIRRKVSKKGEAKNPSPKRNHMKELL